jgi:hypothetical protein
MSDINPTRRTVLIGGASIAAGAVLPMPSPIADWWEATEAGFLEGVEIVLKMKVPPSALDEWEPLDALEEGIKIGLELSKRPTPNPATTAMVNPDSRSRLLMGPGARSSRV